MVYYVNVRIDILDDSVRPNGTSRGDSGMDTFISNTWKANMFGFLLGIFNFFTLILKNT